MQDVSAANGGTAGAFFAFAPAASGSWRLVTRQGATSTANVAVTVVVNAW